MRATSFTAEELEELRRFDAEVDAAEMAEEDYGVTGLVDDLLFPQKAKERERKRAYYLANRERILEKDRARREAQPEKEAARKARWYQENKARIAAHQREYRVRAGIQMSPEEKAAKKAKRREYQREYQRAYREKNREKMAAYQRTHRELRKAAASA